MSLDQQSQFVKHQSATRDAFLGGRIILSQPATGFRAGMDSVLLGASVPADTHKLLDLGAGVGTAALVALSLGLAHEAILAERDEETLALGVTNIEANGFGARARAIGVDLAAPPAQRRAAGLADNAFDTVIANPPFFTSGQGTKAPAVQRADARHMGSEALEQWARCAAAAASAGGHVIFIYPAAGLAELLQAFTTRFGGLTILPLVPREGARANRVLVRGIKGSRAPLTLLASRAVHGAEGRAFSPHFDAIFRGEAAFDW